MRASHASRLAQLSDALIAWAAGQLRPLPWGNKPDPYPVWISEVMSQQSTMAMVMPFFRRWMQRFPTLESLAEAPSEDVLKMWAGLGYYSRARNVHACARALLAFQGEHRRWPQTRDEWLELPGVGPYTAAAVASIAFDDSCLPMDGNVLRVMSRFCQVADPLNKAADRRALEVELARTASHVAKGKHGQLTQALITLGAQICKVGEQAVCDLCPLQTACEARAMQQVERFPRRKERKKTQKIQLLAISYRDPKGRLLLRQIPAGMRLAGHWELPYMEVPEQQLPRLRTCFDVQGPVSHTITHHSYKVYRVEAGRWQGEVPEGHRFWGEGEALPGPISTQTRKLLAVSG